jgi:hypothetical protein
MKKYISKKLKKYTENLFNNKCFFCNLDLTDAKKGQKHFHHFMKESDGADTDLDSVVLSCSNCHKKVHQKIKLNYEELRKIIIEILAVCLNYKDKKIFVSEQENLINKEGGNLEYLYFRKAAYLNLCLSLDIIPTTGSAYNYDDDLSFNNYRMIPKYKNKVIKSILRDLDKKVGLMNIKSSYHAPPIKKKKKEVIIRNMLEWFDSLYFENDRKKLDNAIQKFIKKAKEGKVTIEDSASIMILIKQNNSEFSNKIKSWEVQKKLK